MSQHVRVRYAPSPTGNLHIGNARTALFNYLFARHYGGAFIIRIEDTDEKRNIVGGEESQLKYLKWLGISWDESVDIGGPYAPYRQSERNHIYQKHIQTLLQTKDAYYCYCSEEELEQEREEQSSSGQMPRYSGRCRNLSPEDQKRFESEGKKPSIRFKVPSNKTYVFDDMVKGNVSFESNDMGDFVIIKKDGIPTYNFAAAIDDYEMKITHVLRGDDHISNTPKQMMIFDALQFEKPIYGHMTLIVNEQRKKLSKRDESIIQFIEQYDSLGYLPEAMFNFISLLGWSPTGEEEIFSREELIKIFDEKRLSKSPALFDPKKLSWVNNQYVKKLSFEDFEKLTLPHLQKFRSEMDFTSPEMKVWTRSLLELYQEQISFGAEITEVSDLFFREELMLDEESNLVIQGEQVPLVLNTMKELLVSTSEFTPESIREVIQQVQVKTAQKGKNLFMPIRVAVSGQTHGPELPKVIYLIGKEKVLARLQRVLT